MIARIALGLALIAAPPAFARSHEPARPVTVTADYLCPAPEPDTITVCGSRPATRRDLAALHLLAQCLVYEESGEARAFLDRPYHANTARQTLERMVATRPDCVPHGKFRISAILFTGALAEAALGPIARRDRLAEAVARDPGRVLPATDEVELMSLCLVRSAPAEVSALFASEAGVRREAEAARALVAPIQSCLRRGLRLAINPPALRALLALAAWRVVRSDGAS